MAGGAALHQRDGLRPVTGREARRRVRVESLGEWHLPADRADPVTTLENQGYRRDRDQMPVRFGRMLTSPLAFHRGAAAVMAADLAAMPTTGILAQLAGDAQVSNFGLFEAPGQELVFDLADFDETLPGPWDWDVRRLGASLEIAARQGGWPADRRGAIVGEAVDAYREAMRVFGSSPYLDVWHARPDGRDLRRLGSTPPPNLESATGRAREGQLRLDALTDRRHGVVRFRSTPPVLERIEDVMTAEESGLFVSAVRDTLRGYADGLTDDRRQVFERYEYRDLARESAGIGSLGLRTVLMLLQNRETSEPLVLRVREAGSSLLEGHAGRSPYRQHGRRVVEGQRLMQAGLDLFLGWARGPSPGGVTREYYVRQVWSWKAAADPDSMTAGDLRLFGRLCGWTLARAHARSGNRLAIADYLDGAGRFAAAVRAFAVAYADQNELDYEALVDAARRGRIIAQQGA